LVQQPIPAAPTKAPAIKVASRKPLRSFGGEKRPLAEPPNGGTKEKLVSLTSKARNLGEMAPTKFPQEKGRGQLNEPQVRDGKPMRGRKPSKMQKGGLEEDKDGGDFSVAKKKYSIGGSSGGGTSR